MGCFLSLVEPVVIVSTVGNSFYGTALTLAVYNRTLEQTGGQTDQAQALSSHFFLVNSCVTSLLSFVATALLGWLADRHGPRVLLVVPQIGYFLSKFFLLAFVLLRLPLSVLYVEAVVHGLCGGGPAFWGGVISLAALSSDQEQRSLKLNVVDFCSGVAGVVGGLLSGYMYQWGQSGVVLVLMGLLLCAGALLYSVFLFSYPKPSGREGAGHTALSQEPPWMDRVGVALHFSAMALFMLGMCGAENMLSLYVLKPPLSWDSVWLGYGRAATSAMYLTSFLGVLVLSRPLGDTMLILLGIVSNCTGLAIMAFATHSWVYFFARGIMMFACIPMPTIRAQLSKTLDPQLYGRVFGWQQSALAVTEVVSTMVFASIYPLTLGWYSGFIFLLSCAISYLSVVPILYLNWRGIRQGYTPIAGTDQLQHPLNTGES